MPIIEHALRRRPAEPPELSVPHALVALLVASVAADGELKIEEAVRLSGLLSASRAIQQGGQGSMASLAENAVTLLTDYGMPAVLLAAAKAIPGNLRPTAFALATDLVLADGRIGARERAFLDELQVVLHVDDATAAKIVDVMLVKNHG